MNKKLLLILVLPLAALAALFTSACRWQSRPALYVYNWDAYMAPEAVKLFEKRFGCRVVLDTFDSNEAMYAKVKAGAGGYDVIFPSSYQAYIMHEEGMLLELDHALLPNLASVDREYLHRFGIDKGMAYSVPYMTGSTGIGYRESAVEGFEPSWTVFDRADLRGRMTLLNDMRETLGAALKLLGHSLNTRDEAQINAAADVVIRWKANIAKFENEGYKQGIASREFHVVHGYSGDILQVIEENDDPDIVYALPVEGFSIWEDGMVIPVDASNAGLAHAFINFMHDPEVAVMNMEYNYYMCPNTAAYALVDPELKEDPNVFIPEALRAKAEMIEPLGEDLQKYIRAWDRAKAER